MILSDEMITRSRRFNQLIILSKKDTFKHLAARYGIISVRSYTLLLSIRFSVILYRPVLLYIQTLQQQLRLVDVLSGRNHHGSR